MEVSEHSAPGLSFRDYLKTNRRGWLDLLIAMVLTLVVLLALFQLRLLSHQRDFTDQASRAFNRIHEKISINKTVLEGFASMLRLAGDSPTIRQYTAEMRLIYPHIYSVGFQQYVPAHRKQSFEQQLRNRGYQDYRIKDFSYEEDRQFHEVTPVASYYPTLFADSNNPDVQEVMGLDQFAVPFLKQALLESIKTGQATATRPFTLAEGGRGYVLYKSLEPIPEFDINSSEDYNSTTVSILVKTDVLLNLAVDYMPFVTAQLSYRDITDADLVDTLSATKEVSYLVRFGSLQYERQLNDTGQPFLLTLTKANGFSIWDVTLGLAVVMLSLLGCTLFFQGKYRRQLTLAEKEHDLGKLQEERQLLESRVSERTLQLQRKTNETQALAAKIVNIQEEDYRYIARELHDEIGQLITTIGINTKLIANRMHDDSKVQNISLETQNIIDNLHTSMHSLIGRLRPEALDTFGLRASIELCIDQFKLEQSGIDLKLNLEPSIDGLSDSHTITIYRAVQELVNNAVKHGRPDQIKVDVALEAGGILILVSDNGNGLHSSTYQPGFGLSGLQERVQALSGTMQIESSNNSGCSVAINIPLDTEKSTYHADEA